MVLTYRTKLLLGFELVVSLTAILITWAGLSFISRTVRKEALLRVEMDLGGARLGFEAEKSRLQIVLGIASQLETFREALRARRAVGPTVQELEAFRSKHQFDFLTLTDAGGTVIARSQPPYVTGDRAWSNPVLRDALSGKVGTGTLIVPPEVLRLEGEALNDRAFVPLVYTEQAVPTDRAAERRGMVVMAAIPILEPGEKVLGVLYGGVLLNGKFSLVDRIRDGAFGDATYEGKPVGTVTFFLGDVRIATNVMLDGGIRALGTRVSREVFQAVLKNGERYVDRAFVVNDWYMSAYDPIRDPEGRIIGIIYVGFLEKRFLEYRSDLAWQFLGISLLALLLSGAVAFYLSSGFREPIRKLVRATQALSDGDLATRVRVDRSSLEMMALSAAFNSMANALQYRTAELEEASSALERALVQAEEKNRAYMETLGFVTHELKSPLASIVFAIGSLRDNILGPLNNAQQAVLKSASSSADYLRGTIANYLNLSRIEEGELRLALSSVAFKRDILDPLVDRMSEIAVERNMKIVCEVGPELSGTCDRNLLTSVFQNLLSNALKYGRPGGEIRIRGEKDHETDLLRFSVWNEGEGFDPVSAERLFAKFFRLRAEAETKPGTGVGLFVARKIVEKHGGDLWAESQPGQWATFRFTLPLHPVEPQPEP